MKKIFIFMLAGLSCACSRPSAPITMDQIDVEENAGNFTKATHLIDLYVAENELSPEVVYDLNWRKDKMHRIRLDFNRDKAAVLEYIHKYYPDANDDSLSRWESKNFLEYRIIDGEKKYFGNAAPNLFRLNPAAVARKAEVTPPAATDKQSTLEVHLPAVVNELAKNGKTQVAPIGMKVKFEVTLKPNVVPAGEVVRCWLPYPREDNRRQTDVRLLSVNDSNYVIAPKNAPHRTLYMEKTVQKDEPLTFTYEFSYRFAAEWFALDTKNIQPYDTNSELYKTYTAERPPHILFSDTIKALAKQIVGDETNPYQKVKKLWEWIDVTFPWASALEYSTIDHIPEYVLKNGHGDCGQVTLLFMTMARYCGIPARWQSGLMMHPNSLNLHDWSEYYIEGIGWIPMDESFGVNNFATNDDVKYFYSNGMDAYRWIVNSDFSQPLYPNKIFTRSDNIDFQRGELEWRGGNIYYDQWNWDFSVSYE